MSEHNLAGHIPFCSCTKCKTHRLSHQSHPSSTLNAGLFVVGAATKLADLTDARGVKLGDCVPPKALTVLVRSLSISDYLTLTAPGATDSYIIDPQAGVELAVADIATHEISSTGEGSIAVSYTRSMMDRE